jgi:hypothetical protein
MSCQLEFKVVDFPGIKYQEEEAYLIVNNQFSQSQCSKKFEIEGRNIPQCASNLPTKVINSGAVDGFCEGELELRTFFLASSGAKINHRH